MFTADVAVEEQDEISQDPSCMLAHSQGTLCRVVHFRISTTAPAVGLSKVPPKNDKNYVTYHTVPRAGILLNEPEKTRENIYHDSYSYLLVQQYNYYLVTEREKSNTTR